MKYIYSIYIIILLSLISCETEQLPSPPQNITDIEAYYVNDTAISINSGWWQRKNFTNLILSNQTIGIINNEAGVLNVNGTLNGLTSYNYGDTAGVTVKALYNNNYLYILVEWADKTTNVSAKNWVYNGNIDPLKPSELNNKWTSQSSSDNIIFNFSNIDGNSSDIWHWNAAISAPLGYAFDKHTNSEGAIIDDAGNKMYIRNSNDISYTSGPKYEWSGDPQNVTYIDGKNLTLDPAFFLIKTIPFSGNIENGELIYNNECIHCHGINGSGEQSDDFPDVYAVALNSSNYSRYSRTAISNAILREDHDGEGHFAPLSENSRTDLLSYLRGIQGISGYLLQLPDGSMADIKVASTFNAFKVKSSNTTYKVMFIRKLNTGNSDDIVFNPANIYKLNISISDNDMDNSIGTNGLMVKFIKD